MTATDKAFDKLNAALAERRARAEAGARCPLLAALRTENQAMKNAARKTFLGIVMVASMGLVACDETLTTDDSLTNTYPSYEACIANAVTAMQQTQCANAFP